MAFSFFYNIFGKKPHSVKKEIMENKYFKKIQKKTIKKYFFLKIQLTTTDLQLKNYIEKISKQKYNINIKKEIS